jgi:hypothetical protein
LLKAKSLGFLYPLETCNPKAFVPPAPRDAAVHGGADRGQALGVRRP